MAETDRNSDPAGWSEVWVVATFVLTAFSLVFLLAAHVSGFLAGSLSGFGTLPGVVVFGYLWLLVVVGVRWVLSPGGLDGLRERSVRSLLARSAAGGAFIGGGFLFGAVLVGGVAVAVTNPDVLTAVAIGLFVGTAVAAVVGAPVGVVFGVFTALLLRASDRLLRAAGGDDSAPGGTGRE